MSCAKDCWKRSGYKVQLLFKHPCLFSLINLVLALCVLSTDTKLCQLRMLKHDVCVSIDLRCPPPTLTFQYGEVSPHHFLALSLLPRYSSDEVIFLPLSASSSYRWFLVIK
ncbi:uncharacterized protein LOC143426401 [Xylocopa sonorina]|uniref:uncharacterized protein LOC143426401 n=1 Tax=Xylocopa sonorina TaxID=1818115 RepID=UPI00403AD88F